MGYNDGAADEGDPIYVINQEDCIECGSCAEVCPEGAISQGDGRYVIDQDLCIECQTCLDECPSEAIVEQ